MNEQEMKRQRIYDLLNAETKPKFLYLLCIKQRKNELFKEKGEWGIEQKTKRKLFNCLRYGD